MQKEKTSEWPPLAAPMLTLLVLLLGSVHAARAEDTTTPAADAAASAMDPNATVGDMIRLAKQAGEREFAAKLNPSRKSAGKEASADPVMERNPVLLALYGTDRNYKAELDINGQSRVVPVPGPLQKMGPWKYIALMEEGVLLSKQPQDGEAAARSRSGGTARGSALLPCQQKETCLFLSVPKGAGDSRSLVAPDAQARLLVNQLPGGSRAAALEFGGKPQPAGDRIHMGNAAAAAR